MNTTVAILVLFAVIVLTQVLCAIAKEMFGQNGFLLSLPGAIVMGYNARRVAGYLSDKLSKRSEQK